MEHREQMRPSCASVIHNDNNPLSRVKDTEGGSSSFFRSVKYISLQILDATAERAVTRPVALTVFHATGRMVRD